MRSKRIILISVLALIMVAVAALYLWPVPRASFDRLYAKVDPQVVQSLKAFRESHRLQRLEVKGKIWEYNLAGSGPETIVFLHGMTGAYDISWLVTQALEDQFRIVSLSYPPVQSLGDLEKGLLAILEKEGVDTFHVVGTSLGGYFAQYLISRRPDRIRRAVLANTFPPNDRIAEKTRTLGSILPFVPERMVMAYFRRNFEDVIFPSSGHDELTLAFLKEMGYGRMSKAQLIGRYACVVEKFQIAPSSVPVLIIESANDPLVEPALREQLKAAYPGAEVHTFPDAGHFPYLNRPEQYVRQLKEFLSWP